MSQFSIPQRGSALIITMLIVAAISAAAFGISRIFLADVRVSGAIEDSLMAYYAAEAGAEEGLLRYRVDRLNEQGLNEIAPPGLSQNINVGDYQMSTTFMTDAVIDTRTEDNLQYPLGVVEQDETVEIATIPNQSGDVRANWQWVGGAPANPECGVEITSVLSGGAFNKELLTGNTNTGTSVDTGGRTAVRVKPLCGDLAWVTFNASGQIGRTVQTIDSLGTVGRAKRRLEAKLDRQSGEIVGFFDFVLGSEGDLIQ